MSEELFELRHLIEAGEYPQALALIDEMEEMSVDDKITKVTSYMRVLLTHRIKQAAEQRSTRSWDNSMWQAVKNIVRSNKRRKAGSYYLDEDSLAEALIDVYADALKWAAQEAFGGAYTEDQLGAMVGSRDDP